MTVVMKSMRMPQIQTTAVRHGSEFIGRFRPGMFGSYALHFSLTDGSVHHQGVVPINLGFPRSR